MIRQKHLEKTVPPLGYFAMILAMAGFLGAGFSFMAALATAIFVPRLPVKPALVFALGLSVIISFLAIGMPARDGLGPYTTGLLMLFAVTAAGCVLGALPIVLMQALLRFCRLNKQA